MLNGFVRESYELVIDELKAGRKTGSRQLALRAEFDVCSWMMSDVFHTFFLLRRSRRSCDVEGTTHGEPLLYSESRRIMTTAMVRLCRKVDRSKHHC